MYHNAALDLCGVPVASVLVVGLQSRKPAHPVLPGRPLTRIERLDKLSLVVSCRASLTPSRRVWNPMELAILQHIVR